MVRRSLQASLTGIQQAKRAFALKGWTQENLAGEVNLKTRQPIWRFFTGRSVDRLVTSCRTAAQKLRLRGFTDVEIAHKCRRTGAVDEATN